ncbi:MAG TPA: hypothetical protein VF431_03435, partial [Candidatus Methylomirabilis sp.]
MTNDSLDRLLTRLEASRGRFGPAEGARTERLLAGLERRRFPDPELLIRFHEALLFLRAFPASGRVARQAEVLLSAFGERVEALRRAGADLSS